MEYTTRNTVCDTWFERDRQSAILSTLVNDEVIMELWDSAMDEFIDDGFKRSCHSWHTALVEYANQHKISPRKAK